jgi:HEAT repeat protein
MKISRSRVLDMYDIPDDVFTGEHSAAFVQFLRNWFGDSRPLSRGEVDLKFLDDLTPEERQLAKDLLHRNLGLKYVHLIEGAAALHDVDAVPTLRAMFAAEADESRQLTIAGTLWKLNRDPAFIDCLNRLKASHDGAFKRAHFHQITWLGDERAIDLLIDLLDDDDSFVRFLASTTLNELEFEKRFMVVAKELPRRPEDYRSRQRDAAFRALMVGHLRS